MAVSNGVSKEFAQNWFNKQHNFYSPSSFSLLIYMFKTNKQNMVKGKPMIYYTTHQKNILLNKNFESKVKNFSSWIKQKKERTSINR